MTAAESHEDVLDAVMAVLQPIVECNRAQVENGRTYLREMVFGDPTEPQRRAALAIVGQTEAAITAILTRDETTPPTTAATLAHVISAVMFLEMSASTNLNTATNELVSGIRRQVQAAIAR